MVRDYWDDEFVFLWGLKLKTPIPATVRDRSYQQKDYLKG